MACHPAGTENKIPNRSQSAGFRQICDLIPSHLVPELGVVRQPHTQYQRNRTGEDNADAHLKRQIMGREVVVAFTRGKLDFGPWKQIF